MNNESNLENAAGQVEKKAWISPEMNEISVNGQFGYILEYTTGGPDPS